MEEVIVRVGQTSYPVCIGSNLLEQAGHHLSKLKLGKKVAVIADASIAETHGEKLMKSLRASGFTASIVGVASGERSKDLSQVTPLLSFLAQNHLDRTCPVVALGGGVIGDLAGFVAAIYLRGVPLIQIPTTLLSMVDSSVGGKTGVNLPEGKNLVGSFYQPELVLADLDTLSTLPEREQRAGMAEIIKYGVIADASLFLKVAQGRPRSMVDIIRRSVEIKAEIVAADERETTGRRALLNFGHTLGHAIEQAAGYGELRHGEAVAIGMRAAAHLSHIKLGLSLKEVHQIENAIAANHLPLDAKGLDLARVRRALGQDKKVRSGVIRWVLTPQIGEAVLSSDVSESEIESIIELCLT